MMNSSDKMVVIVVVVEVVVKKDIRKEGLESGYLFSGLHLMVVRVFAGALHGLSLFFFSFSLW